MHLRSIEIKQSPPVQIALRLEHVLSGLECVERLGISAHLEQGDAQKGRRPSFISAARPEKAIPLYERFIAMLRERGATVETGEFGATMDVELVNDGPVTIWLER